MNRWFRWTLLTLVGVVALAGLGYGAMVGRFWLSFRRDTCRVTPLMYHQVINDSREPARYWMQEQEFARQLAELEAAGAVTPPLDSILAWLDQPRGECPFPANTLVLTFDLDGSSAHDRLVLPHLIRHGFRAVFFVPVMNLGRNPGVTVEELQRLAAAGMTVGSHSEHHYDMRREHPDSMVASLLRTRDRLGAVTGQPVATLSAPGGRYDDSVVAGVGRAGFTTFFTSDPCYITGDSPPLTLCRVEIRGDGGMTALEAAQSPWRVAVQATGWAIKRRLEAMVGPRFWRLFHFLRTELEGPGY